MINTNFKHVIRTLGSSIYWVFFVGGGILFVVLSLLSMFLYSTWPWGFLFLSVCASSAYGLYRLRKWADKEEPPVPSVLRNLSMDEAHTMAMAADPRYKEDNDAFWSQIADETEKLHGDRDFHKGPIERAKELQKKP